MLGNLHSDDSFFHPLHFLYPKGINPNHLSYSRQKTATEAVHWPLAISGLRLTTLDFQFHILWICRAGTAITILLDFIGFLFLLEYQNEICWMYSILRPHFRKMSIRICILGVRLTSIKKICFFNFGSYLHQIQLYLRIGSSSGMDRHLINRGTIF